VNIIYVVIEDTEYTYDQIKSEFGVDVAEGVNALTKDKSLSIKLEQMENSLERIKQQPVEIWLVKLADRITNLSAPPFYRNRDKMVKYQNEARLILEKLGSSNELLAARLASRINSYQAFIDQV